MTLTQHGHHIDGTPTEDEKPIALVRCGGPGVCEACSFESAWRKDFAKHKTMIEPCVFPDDVKSLEAKTLRKIAAKLKSRHHAPSLMMRIPKYQLAFTIYALADAMEGVAKDLEKE